MNELRISPAGEGGSEGSPVTGRSSESGSKSNNVTGSISLVRGAHDAKNKFEFGEGGIISFDVMAPSSGNADAFWGITLFYQPVLVQLFGPLQIFL